jgi:proline dehydrogenase
MRAPSKEKGIADVKALARKYTPEEIEACIHDQITKGTNTCSTGPSHEALLKDLARAQVVRDLMDDGLNLHDALREVARRIRMIGKGGGL